MTLLGEWIHFCEAKENVNKYWFSKMPYRVFLVSESRKRIVIWINNNTVFAIIFNRFLKQNKSLFKNLICIYYFLIGCSHLEVFYKMRLLNSLAKYWGKIFDFFGFFLFEKMNPNLLANEIFSSILLKFQI